MPQRKPNWDHNAEYYARYRPGPPDSYYNLVGHLTGGFRGRTAVDLGTGPGLVAIQLAERGSHVSGYDISQRQIEQARIRAQGMARPPVFFAGAAEDLLADAPKLDLAIANMSWWYLDSGRILDLLSIKMNPQSSLIISEFNSLPEDPANRIAEAVLHNYGGHRIRPDQFSPSPWCGRLSENHFFVQRAVIGYTEAIPFTVEGWVGRWLASKAVLMTLPREMTTHFASTLQQEIRQDLGEQFLVHHGISIQIYGPSEASF